MKHITLAAFAAALALPMMGQEIFSSGFEDWTGSVPDDWVGAKTNIAASNVTQVSTDVHSGNFAVRLANTSTSHQRFTTQPLSVTNGQTYTVTFWVRGEGQVRVGLFDDRPGGSSGYAPYNPNNYVSITGNTWQEVSLPIVAANDAGNAEFILSLRNTVAPEHLVIDDVSITEGGTVDPPTPATITEIQTTSAPDGASPLVGQLVSTSGVVTGIITGNNPGFFMQDGTGPWTGIFVFTDPASLTIGDAVSLNGSVVEFNGQTQLAGVTDLTTTSTGNVVMGTVISTAQGNTEPYESVLVKVVGATVTAAGQFGQHTVNDNSGPVLVDDVLFAYPFVVGTVYNITGVLQYAFNEWRILPRSTSDVEISTSIGELAGANVNLYPNPASDIINLEVGPIDGRLEFQITDLSGRVVASDVITAARMAVDLSGLTNGTYAVTLRNAGSAWTTRIVVAR